ncbi:LysR family transcriptional regulator [Pseudidiomarina sp. E22-M8]|uniref:LysR family transcriptional regulator n=1 Tax=Pseudidiomarina sp. E22-M8 TaxID=3424768 RepID=UPI00403CA80D
MDLRHINFRLLEVFSQVVEQQSISAAARQLYLTQPTVSAQIRRLEEIFASKLLQQQGRRMFPTVAGEQLYKAAGDAIRRMQDCKEKLSAINAGIAGELKIALVNTAQYVLPQLVAQFNQHYPDIQIELSIGNRESTLQRYFQNKDDIYLFSHPPTDPNADAQAFMKNQLVLIAPPDHWAVDEQHIDFHKLKNERFLIRENGSATRMVFDSWLAGHGIQLSHRTQIESNEAIRLSVASGSGLAVLSQHIVAHGSDPVATLNVTGFPLPGQWYIVSRRDSMQQQIITRFRDIAQVRPLPAM